MPERRTRRINDRMRIDSLTAILWSTLRNPFQEPSLRVCTVCVHGCMHMCIHGCKCVHVKGEDQSPSSSVTLHPYFWDSLFIEPGVHWWAELSDQWVTQGTCQSLRFSPPPAPSAVVIRMNYHAWLFTWVLGSEPKSSCLHASPSYWTISHLPSVTFVSFFTMCCLCLFSHVPGSRRQTWYLVALYLRHFT